METTAHVTVFPLKLQPTFSEVVSKAAKLTPYTKHDWVVKAIEEKLERDNEELERRNRAIGF